MSWKKNEYDTSPERVSGHKSGGFLDDSRADIKRVSPTNAAKAEEKKSRRANNRLKGDVGQFRRVHRPE